MGTKPVLELLAVANTGMTVAQYEQSIRDWLKTAKAPALRASLHRPRLQADAGAARPSARQRLQDLHRLRRRHRVHARWTGRPTAFRRSRWWARSPRSKYGFVDGKAGADAPAEGRLRRRRPGKPVGIYRAIGRRPIFAFGNSDGDWQMLQWTAAGEGPRFMGLVHHTDAAREYAYDRARRSASSTRPGTTPSPRAGRSST
jgi:hypothetical protein